MNDEDLQHFRFLLEAQQRALRDLEETGKAATATVVLDQSSVGRLSRMDAMQGQAMAQASQRRREEQLRRIAAALARIDRGDYGYCIDCDEEVARGRLESNPTVTLCVDCASQRESR